MTQTGRRARVVHAIPGRLRIRFEGAALTPASDGLAGARVAPGVLAIEPKPASHSVVVRYDPTRTTEAIVLAELERAGIEVVQEEIPHPPTTRVTPASGRGGEGVGDGAQRDTRGRFVRQSEAAEPAAEAEPAGSEAQASKSGGRSELWEMLIGPPPKLDRRFAESLTLSAVSLLAARRVGLALGGGTTLPAYFVIWFALRRMTGLGRRR
jgi:hypothetical protein